ncbi:MAG: ATP-dependent helicase [Desulfobulbaceae bacterium]|jgi:DNA helicase-2/ATP-dependent DNA helicase PcrA|nr:ATP-dependent helicase [Desulfobulbaceae bacterium]
MSDYQHDSLNEAQHLAVTTTTGPVLVIAGAGSGKTRTLVHRVAYLIAEGVEPWQILLLTFTRKAAQEMLWRAAGLVGDSSAQVTGGTFHAIANNLLRRYANAIGYPSSFSIIDQADAEGIINLLKSSLGMGKENRQFPSKRAIIGIFSGAVNRSVGVPDIIERNYSHMAEHLDQILTLHQYYQSYKREHALMDYDDLLVNWRLLLAEHPEARDALSRRFAYIMVDEYQDTNLIQAEIVRLLAAPHNNVMVVGDDSQSIYSFRGADFHNIMRFPDLFPGASLIKLEENYRSTQPILTLTNSIIQAAAEKYAKTLFSRIEGGAKPQLYPARDERDEASFVVENIQKLIADGTPAWEIAVLFRSGFHSFRVELELAAAGHNFEKRGGLKLTESAHMKDVLAFLRLLVNPHDGLSWSRVFLQLEKIGPKTAQKFTTALVNATDTWQALAELPVKANFHDGFAALRRLFTDLRGGDSTPSSLYEKIFIYYQPILQRLYADDYPKRQKDLDQLKSIILAYADVRSFIDDTMLDPPNVRDESSRDRLILSTIHSAKGLEFDAVFVIGLADGRFPHSAAGAMGAQYEEERRLLYVAATRARKHLWLTYPCELMTADRMFNRANMSPFLAEIPPHLYKRLRTRDMSAPIFTRTRPITPSVDSPTLAKEADLIPGQRVSHAFYGAGIVTALGADRSFSVRFDRHGLKTLHFDYVRLTLL